MFYRIIMNHSLANNSWKIEKKTFVLFEQQFCTLGSIFAWGHIQKVPRSLASDFKKHLAITDGITVFTVSTQRTEICVIFKKMIFLKGSDIHDIILI